MARRFPTRRTDIKKVSVIQEHRDADSTNTRDQLMWSRDCPQASL